MLSGSRSIQIPFFLFLVILLAQFIKQVPPRKRGITLSIGSVLLEIPVAFVLLMATIVVPGFNNLFHVSHLSLTQWLAVIVGSFLIVVLVELVKAIQRALGKDKDAI